MTDFTVYVDLSEDIFKKPRRVGQFKQNLSLIRGYTVNFVDMFLFYFYEFVISSWKFENGAMSIITEVQLLFYDNYSRQKSVDTKKTQSFIGYCR